MGDEYRWSLSQAQAQRASSESSSSDEETSWVMLRQSGDIQPFENEKILHKNTARVGCEISKPSDDRSPTPFNLKSDSGRLYLTNQRVIYLSDITNKPFKNFSAPILRFQDTHTSASGILGLGAWRWGGVVRPTTGGGVPSDMPLVDVRFTFYEGGHSDFQSKFELLRERLQHAQQLERETGQRILVHDEELPAYEAAREVSSSPPPHEQSAGPASTVVSPTLPTTRTAEGGSQPTPDEPPPDYDTAQAQAVSMRFEERDREDAERQ